VGATGPSRLEAPRFACRLLHWVLGSQRAEPVEEGLEELFRLRVERDGPAAARAWYRRQVLGFIWRRRSLREGSPRTGALEPERPPRWRILADAWAQDVKLAARSLRRAPGFTALAVGTLAIGIAANATVFSVLDGALFRPLPIPSSQFFPTAAAAVTRATSRTTWRASRPRPAPSAARTASSPPRLVARTSTRLARFVATRSSTQATTPMNGANRLLAQP